MPPPPPPGATGAVLDDRLPLDGEGLEAAFESLYRSHRERVLRLCRAMTGHPQDAEEAAQATMLSAYRALERGDRPGVIGAWLTTIARNECRDLIGRRRPEVQLPDALPSGASSDPADVVERRERMRELRHDLAELPPGQRTAIVLRSMAGMRHSEIAEVVGGSEQAARTLVYEARESLAEFAEGRALGCADVRPRIDSGDGRALRARRVRAHMRVCEECRAAAGSRRGRLAGLLPIPAFLTALRGLFAGSTVAPVAGGAALVSLVTAGALVVPGPWNPLSAPADAAPMTAPAPSPTAPTSLTGALAGSAAAPAAAPAAGARTSPAPGDGPAPGATPVAGGAAAAPPAGPAAGSAPSGSDPSGGDRRTGATPLVGVSADGGGVGVTVAGVGVRADSGGVAVTSPPASVSVRPPSPGGIVPTVDAEVPAVQVPEVSVPSATVPSVSTPPVTVPSQRVGPITTPEVAVPSLSTPEVTTPAVAAPSQVATPAAGPVPPITVDLVGTPRITIGDR
jgi:RNA polymerase sigma factor (sigma-70 family)